MTWSSGKTAALATGILVPLLMVIACICVWRYRKQKSAAHKPEDVESQPPAEDAPNAGYDSGTVRRTTGHPQTFQDWVRANGGEPGKYERYPALGQGQHGADSGLNQAASTDISKPTPPASSATTASLANNTAMARPETRGSLGGSSFRRAVLEASSDDDTPVSKADTKVGNSHTEKLPQKTISKTYSGAWP